VAEVAKRCRLQYKTSIVKIQDGREKVYELRYRAEPIQLPGRSEKLWLVVIAGFGEKVMMLLASPLIPFASHLTINLSRLYQPKKASLL